MESSKGFRLPNEFEFDGLYLHGGFNKETLTKLATSYHFRDDDSLLVTYSKSGTTWMQAIMYLLKHRDDLENEEFAGNPMGFIPFLELRENFAKAEGMPSPRFIKSHMPYRILKNAISDQNKIIVVMRNPKDTLVSFFKFYQMNITINFDGTWDEFFELFKNDRIIGGNWFAYTLGWWALREKKNILYAWFEDMKKDLPKEIKRVAEFLGISVTEDDVKKIAKMTTFNNFQKNMSTYLDDPAITPFDITKSRFLRKGSIGDWKNYFTVAQNEYFDKIYEENMKGSELHFDFE